MRYFIVFVLATDIQRTDDGKFIFKAEDEFGALDQGYRLQAAKILLEGGLTAKIVLVGGKNEKLNKWRPDVMEEYLKERGIQQAKIDKLYCEPGNTCGSAKSIIKYVIENNVWKDKNRVGFLTNFYHIPRIQKLLTKMLIEHPDFNHNNLSVAIFEPIVAESIIAEQGNYEDFYRILKFYQQEPMTKRFISEFQGAKDIEMGRYPCSW